MPSGQFSFQRPVLIILDRNMDLCTPLHHTWTYQALVHDVLVSELSNNTSSWMYSMTDEYNLTKIIIIIKTIIIEFTFPQNGSPTYVNDHQ